MKKQKLVVLSADALVYEDLEYLSALPNFKKYLAGGSMIKRVRTVYPTITFPAHISISTGAYPDKHGILGNDEFEAGRMSNPWQWFSSAVKIPDIFSAAKKAGLTTAAVFWPVTGKHPDIDYLIDEYWAQGKDDTSRAAFERSGSSKEILTKVIDKYIGDLVDRKHPTADYFVINCARDILLGYKPDLLMIHPANIDAYRHGYGLFNDRVSQGIRETDEWIGVLGEAAEKAGIADETNFVLISDHGQLEIKRVINPNVILADNGFIKYDADGRLTEWKAYCHSGGMSALVYLNDPGDKKVYGEVYKLLLHMRDEGIYGIGEVYTEREADEKEHLGGDFSFVLETDGYTSFGDSYRRPIVSNFNTTDYRYGKATHGYHPDKGPQPVFIAKGPAFKNGVTIERRPIVDEAPTFAEILGFDMPYAEGEVIREILS